MLRKHTRTTITAALPYANGPVHIGHLAGVYVPSDTYARYLRMKGEDVVFICGSDEHGVAITLQARKKGKTPQQVVDQYHEQIKKSFDDFGIKFDIYHRTSAKIHHETASEMFKALHAKGKFVEKTSKQYFDVREQQFLADRYIRGTCPNCAYKEAYGDQCERCGSTLSPLELKNPKSMLSGEPPILKETTHWYLPLDEYEPWLKQWILEEHKEWKPNVYGQCKSWIDNGLQSRPITRDLDWGIPVPVEGGEGKVLYVWFDAPIGYISATKEWAIREGKNWEDYWKKKDTRLLHFVGKDNIVFHCIIFPTILRAEGSYIVPENVPANEFLNLENNKISTSQNWAVWLHEYLEEFPGKQDVLRYVLSANAPETRDNDFTWTDFQKRNNNELVAIFGNFVNRAVVLTHKYYEGKVPEAGSFHAIDKQTLIAVKSIPAKIEESLDKFKFREALKFMMELARIGNKYLAETEPWKLIKENEERVKTIIHTSLQIVASLGVFASPFLPNTSKTMADLFQLKTLDWEAAKQFDLLFVNQQIKKPTFLFQKIEDEEVRKQVQKLNQTNQNQEVQKITPIKK